jgi:lipid II isoglutaminyl synthase (glutamine-hydrolysing)
MTSSAFKSNLRSAGAILAGKASSLASRTLGRGGGTALPGLVAGHIAPDLLGHLASQLGHGCSAISGTNGKTTTSLMVAEMARAAGMRPLHNRAGSNLARGLTTALLAEASIDGTVSDAAKRIGVFEVDEAALPDLAASLRPRAVALLNLFRDQLDRYGEVDIIADKWRVSVASLPPSTVLVVNADDPSLAPIAETANGRVIRFGLDDRDAVGRVEHAADIRWCHFCSHELTYEPAYYAHIGHWRCAGCGRYRTRPDVSVTRVREKTEGTKVQVVTPLGVIDQVVRLKGLYNAYNAAAAAAVGVAMQLPLEAIAEGLSASQAAFGRQEQFTLDGREVTVLLGKNPTGFNQLLQMLSTIDGKKHLALFLNDGIADGRDVSWIWDVDFELLRGHVASAVVSGRRATDLALRLRYGEICDEMVVEEDIENALRTALAGSPIGTNLYVLPTYTAMLKVRELLARWTRSKHYWQEGP